MEQPIVQATVIALKYSNMTGQWEELGSQKGPCAISIFKSTTNEYRFVSWKESSQEVVLNSFLFPSMNYNETTSTFHQWYDESKTAYGLNFTDSNDAKKFGIAVVSALEILNAPRATIPMANMVNRPIVNQSMSGDNISVNKKAEKPPASSTVSPYATTGISQINDSSAAKPPVVAANKTSGGAAPPPPGPPPTAPAPPGPPPGPPPSGPPPPSSAPIAPIATVKKPANDFASQLLAASQNMKSSLTNSNSENSSTGMTANIGLTASVTPSKPAPAATPAPMNFLVELRLKSQRRTDSGNQNKKVELPKVTAPTTTQPAPVSNVTTKNSINHSSKMSSSNSDLATTSYVTSADLEKFRVEMMQDILYNMDKMKNEIISSIVSKLN